MSYILRVKLNDVWVEIPAIKGDKGDSGASDWDDVENKPFESVGETLVVDSLGELNVDWSQVFDYNSSTNTLTITTE